MAPKFEDVERVFKKWFYFEDVNLLRVTLATVLANRAKGDPVWLYLVGPPSGIKTEIIESLADVEFIYPQSKITSRTFASGYRDGKSSLLLRLPENVVLTYKDFTTILQKDRRERKEIFSDLREIFDGHFCKDVGINNIRIDWRGKIGFIAGVTEVIDCQITLHQILGERFVLYRTPRIDRQRQSQKAIENTGKEEIIRAELGSVVKDFFLYKDFLLPNVNEVNIKFRKEINILADFVTQARTACIRDGYKRDIIYIPEPELPARLTKQLIMLSYGLAVLEDRNESCESDYAVICKVGLDSLPKIKSQVLRALYDGKQRISDIVDSLHYSTSTVQRVLEEFEIYGIVQRVPNVTTPKGDKFQIHPKWEPFLRDVFRIINSISYHISDEIIKADIEVLP
jgi:predicted transcriptional regulator